MEQSNLNFEIPFEEEASPKKVKAEVEVESESAEPHIYTVSEITYAVRDAIENSYPEVWVTGEVSNFRNPESKHYYFSLKDDACQLNAVVFGGKQKLGFALEDGLEVIAHGKLSVYSARGVYQIIIDHLEPKGKGALQIAFEQLKKKLEAEGLFTKERKRPLPFLPRKIGVVTSPTGAAIRDIIHVLTRRFPSIEILLYPVKVQGEGAALEIAEAIGEMNRRSDIDVLIVGRGGGSLEDLWAFNEEPVARAIFASKVPVVSAVGHEIDFTIADFVADVRAPTPSAAAEIVVPRRADLEQTIADLKRQLMLALRQDLQNRWSDVQKLKARIADPTRRFHDLYLRIDGLSERLTLAVKQGLEMRAQTMVKLKSNLTHLSPMHILEKGYSVVTRKGAGGPVKSARSLKEGAALDIRFYEGSAEAKITKTN